MTSEILYFLFEPLHAKFKGTSLQQMKDRIENQQYRFDLAKGLQIIGKSSKIQFRSRDKHQPKIQKVNNDMFYVCEFPREQNLFTLQLNANICESINLSWSIYYITHSSFRRTQKQLKIFRREFRLVNAIQKFQENTENYKYTQRMCFNTDEIQYNFKIYIFTSSSEMIKMKKNLGGNMNLIQNNWDRNHSQQQSVTKETNSISSGTNIDKKTERNKIINKQPVNQQKSSISISIVPPQKFQKPANGLQILSHIRYPSYQQHQQQNQVNVCKTISLYVPDMPTQRFATEQEQQQYNLKIDSFLKDKSTLKDNVRKFINIKSIFLVVIILIVLYFISKQILNEGGDQKIKTRKSKLKNRNKKNRKSK